MTGTDTTVLVGYARVSTGDQTTDAQVDALTAAGCSRIFTDHASGALKERAQLEACLDYLRPGDVLVVWRLDRLGRSLRHLLELVGELEAKGVGLKSLQETIDTTTPGGRLIFHVMGALAEFERALIRERTHAGLQAARARGRHGGRKTIMTPAKLAVAQRLVADGEHTMSDIATTVGVSRSTLYRAIRPATSPTQHDQAHTP